MRASILTVSRDGLASSIVICSSHDAPPATARLARRGGAHGVEIQMAHNSSSARIGWVAGLAVALTGIAATSAFATPAITLTPLAGHPKSTPQVSGTGFGAGEAVDLYFDTTDAVLEFTDG